MRGFPALDTGPTGRLQCRGWGAAVLAARARRASTIAGNAVLVPVKAVEIPRILARPDLRQRFDELASYPPGPPLLGAEYARHVAELAKLWTGVAREANTTAS